ncbi:hypothetical protein [Jannaschia pohangensis]|uniref:Uncharacterized protein n=1 Tax=Jannaschia pohangensis TaxID=390807 RepID=A0A1I3LNE3_9RHOB|nr:hypothetical protein [Jannaschia pohangensis]SFI86278.1 hypothetical protein SAMN04488095_1586 [Jannaschia pohangensis]
MTRFGIIAAATLTATSAFAYTGVSPTIVAEVEQVLETEYSDYTIEQLNDQQVIEIYLASTSTDDGSTKRNRIEAVLADESPMSAAVETRRAAAVEGDFMVYEGENSIVTSVQNFLTSEGFEVDASTLTDAQVAELYFLATSSNGSTDAQDIEAILSM